MTKPTTTMLTSERRYDIDWLRVIAIGLLLLYHVAIGFQPWGMMIGFITHGTSWGSLWIPMMMLNVWRIPLLFFVSGMGVYFAMQSRDWKQLFKERSLRILLPYLFGIFCIVPIHVYLWKYHYGFTLDYSPNPGHLWFLGNLMVYVIVLSPIFYYLKRNEDGLLTTWIKRILSSPFGLLPVIGAFIAEAVILNPRPYELYATTWHGFFLGLLAFFFGFCFVLSGEGFWKMIVTWRWLFLITATGLFALRLMYFQMNTPMYWLVTESQCWIISVLAFGHRYLNRPGKTLRYLSQAAYPVYIIHMIFIYLGSVILFPLEMPAWLTFILLLVFTLAGSLAVYEWIIRRIKFIRPLFGLKTDL